MLKQQAFIAGILMLICTAAQGQLISSFETPDDMWALRPSGGAKVERVKEHATQGQYAVKVFLPGSQKDTWPGVSFVPKQSDLAAYQVIAFDVYNPMQRAQYLSMRIDGANGQKMFAGRNIAPRKKVTYEIYIKGLKSNLGTTKITRIYPYASKPREDRVFYIDNLRFATLDLRFTPLIYEETAPALAPTPEEQRRGYVLFRRHWLDVVFPNSRPRPGEREGALAAFAAQGEYEPITLAVRALRGLKQARVTVSDLRGPRGLIPASEVAVYPVRCLNKRVTYSSKDYIKNMPVLLERRPAADVAKGESKRFWLDVHVPADAAPGVYEGVVTFVADAAPAAKLPIKLRVLPFKLVEPADIMLGDYYRGPMLAKGLKQAREFLERDMRDMRAHGATSVGLCMGFPVDQAKLVRGRVEFALDGSSLWERFMDLYRDLGFPAPLVALADSGQAFARLHSKRTFDAAYVAAYKAFWTGMQTLCKERGWPELIVQPVDEPGWQDRAAKDRNVALLKLLKQIPGMRTEQDGPGDAYFHREAGPYADVWNYNGGIGSPARVAQAKSDGHVIMIYNCDVESYRPEVGRYTAGFFQHRAGISGYYNWAYMSWRGSPYDDLDHTTGTWMHVYPAYDGEVGGPSTGWQGFREGVDDTKYVRTLEEAIRRANRSRNPAAARAAVRGSETLKRVLESIAYSPGVRNRARWTTLRTEKQGGKARKFITGTLKLPNGWDFAAYDLARWRMAQATLEIMAALGEFPAEPPRQAAVESAQGAFAQLEWQSTPKTAKPAPVVVEQIGVPIVERAPVIDGDLGDAAWRQATHIERFSLIKGGEPQQQTEAWICADAANLYIAFKCHENNVRHMTANVTQDNGKVWEDDCVEVFIDANLDRRTCKQIVVNSLSTQLWADSDNPRWRAKSKAAARVGKAAWFVELAIPKRDLGLTGNAFGLNLCRERRPLETLELSAWRPTGGAFRQPSKFGVARIGGSFIQRIDAGRVMLGECALSATVINGLGKPGAFVARLAWSQKGSPAGASHSLPFALAPGATRELSLRYLVDTADAPVRLRFELIDTTANKRVGQYELTRAVEPAMSVRLGRQVYYLNDAWARLDLALALSRDVAKAGAVTVALRKPGADASLRTHTASPIAGDRLAGRINVSGLPEGDYEIVVAVGPGANAPPIASEVIPFTKLRGPFD